MKSPFVPLTFDKMRTLLRGFHKRDPYCAPGVILRLLVGLSSAEIDAAVWGHFHNGERQIEVPSRGSKVGLRRPERGWLNLYRPDDFRPHDPISPLTAKEWAARFRHLQPNLPIGHLRQTWAFYQNATRRPYRYGPNVATERDPHIDILQLPFLHPCHFNPPLDPPVFRKVIAQPVPTLSPLSTDLNLV